MVMKTTLEREIALLRALAKGAYDSGNVRWLKKVEAEMQRKIEMLAKLSK